MWSELDSKTYLVTGAGDGIGNALCKHMVEAGARVYAMSKSADKLAQLQIDYPIIKTIHINLQCWDETRQALGSVPKLDGIVNNAGIAIIKKFDEFTHQDVKDTFGVNFFAPFNIIQQMLPNLRQGGSIVNVSSIASTRSFEQHALYSASKAALDSLTRSLALELASRRIRVNSVNPTVVMTKMGRENWSDPKKAEPLLARIPIGRFCEVDEVTNAIAYLLSSKSSFLNGHQLNLDGGYSVL